MSPVCLSGILLHKAINIYKSDQLVFKLREDLTRPKSALLLVEDVDENHIRVKLSSPPKRRQQTDQPLDKIDTLIVYKEYKKGDRFKHNPHRKE